MHYIGVVAMVGCGGFADMFHFRDFAGSKAGHCWAPLVLWFTSEPICSSMGEHNVI